MMRAPSRSILPAVALIASLAIAPLFALPSAATAQTVAQILEGMRNGGGWIKIPIQAGQGRYTSVPLPTVGMTFAGCVRVWGGHSGRWQIRARDLLGSEAFEYTVVPGDSVPFSYRAGMRSQLEVSVRWSEPRDTTLHVWVGVDPLGRTPGKACTAA